MKAVLSFVFTVALMGATAATSLAEPHQVLQGTQIHLKMLSNINSSTSKDGDPFVAIVTDPVQLGNQLLLPTGTRINGIVTAVSKAKHFAIFRGQAYLNLTFRTVEVDSRLIPVQMSIVAIAHPSSESNRDGKPRKDVKITEGQIVQEKYDIKGNILAGTIGTGGGAIVGAVFGEVVRGFGIGLAGSAVYIVSRKGKEVNLPSQTEMLVRMDNTITVPSVVASNASYGSGR
ncbi:MAG TPA: hypothetical protein VLV88_08395 [Terriglobales bacterium]|nr:hypothetical protein [Terriglobales bacterium]